jgi:flagellar biosynthesis protein
MEKREKEKAVALRYDEHKESAPRVIAKGEGYIAQKIKQIARENNIPVHQDDTLIELLAQVDIDYEIPPELYAAVAEVLCWIYRANNELKEKLPE